MLCAILLAAIFSAASSARRIAALSLVGMSFPYLLRPRPSVDTFRMCTANRRCSRSEYLSLRRCLRNRSRMRRMMVSAGLLHWARWGREG